MPTTAECVAYADFLEQVPSLATCQRGVIERYAATSVIRGYCTAGEVICGLQQDHNLYVLTRGSAELHVGPDVVVQLEPGDYFGQDPSPYRALAGTVVAHSDVEVLIVGPQDLAQLQSDACRQRRPLGAEPTRGVSAVARRRRRDRRRDVLTTLGV
jgi:CRP-like cAMP-binding protein